MKRAHTISVVVSIVMLVNSGCRSDADSRSSNSTGGGTVRVLAYNGSDFVMEFGPRESEEIRDHIQQLIQKSPTSIGLPPIKMAADVRLEIRTEDKSTSYETFGRTYISVVDGSPWSKRTLWYDHEFAKSIVKKVYPETYTTDE
jgi:hypothetical protein